MICRTLVEQLADERGTCGDLLATLTVLALIYPSAARAGDYDPARLDTVTVVATGVSNMNAASAGDVSQEQIASQPPLLLRRKRLSGFRGRFALAGAVSKICRLTSAPAPDPPSGPQAPRCRWT